MKKTASTVFLLLFLATALPAQAQRPATTADSTAAIASALRAGKKDLLTGGARAVVGDRSPGSNHIWPRAVLAGPASQIGAQVVRYSDVVRCVDRTPTGCVLVGNIQLLVVDEADFQGDTALVEVRVLAPSTGTNSIASRSLEYVVVRRAGIWTVTGIKSATYL